MPASTTQNDSSILAAVQLGWLSVETFGLLRRYGLRGKPPSPGKDHASRRFNFTERTPNLYDQLLIAMHMLKATAARLTPNLPPPVPDAPSKLLEEAKKGANPLWRRFEDWSRQVWNHLQVTDPLAGQAFACGGDLADTYWYAQGAGADKLSEMLRSYRLRYLAERVIDLDSYLPEHTAQVLQHSLEAWSIGETVEKMDDAGKDRLLERLESQVKVWRDLLFGLRRSSSYLTADDQRQITWGAAAASAGLVILVSLAVWLAVLTLASVGRSLMGASVKLPVDTAKVSSDVLAYLTDWQNWSALLATVSSVVAVLTGVVRGLSGWLWAFYQNVHQALTLRRIKFRTFRDPAFRRKEQAAS